MNRRLFLLSSSALAVTLTMSLAPPVLAAEPPAPPVPVTGKFGYGFAALSDAMLGDVMASEVVELHLTKVEYDNISHALHFMSVLNPSYRGGLIDRQVLLQNEMVLGYLDGHGKIIIHNDMVGWPEYTRTWEERVLPAENEALA